VREEFLPYSPPDVGSEEIEAVVDALRSDWLTTGPKVRRFEEEFKDFVEAPSALAVNSCTAALHIALAALGIGPGDEVISTTMTFASSIHVIEHLGARPVLVDVESDTLNIDPARVEAAITPRTKAILPVHLYGHPAELDAIWELARRHRLAVVEDAAHSLPARYRGRLIGSPRPDSDGLANPVAFSFYATKNLTTGEGGMLTADTDFIDKARVWSLHGMSRDAYKRYTAEGSWRYDVLLPGFKYNLPELQGALGLVQLGRLPGMMDRRRQIVERYQRGFRPIEEVESPVSRSHVENAWHIFALRLNSEMLKIDRDRFIEELRELNIGTSVHFIPVHKMSYYRDRYGYTDEQLPVAAREFERIISLPLNTRLSDQDVDDVIEAVAVTVERHRR
jgi:dTDP-4-amino-4,6-dideoxygalactose transaminase